MPVCPAETDSGPPRTAALRGRRWGRDGAAPGGDTRGKDSLPTRSGPGPSRSANPGGHDCPAAHLTRAQSPRPLLCPCPPRPASSGSGLGPQFWRREQSWGAGAPCWCPSHRSPTGTRPPRASASLSSCTRKPRAAREEEGSHRLRALLPARQPVATRPQLATAKGRRGRCPARCRVGPWDAETPVTITPPATSSGVCSELGTAELPLAVAPTGAPAGRDAPGRCKGRAGQRGLLLAAPRGPGQGERGGSPSPSASPGSLLLRASAWPDLTQPFPRLPEGSLAEGERAGGRGRVGKVYTCLLC